METLAILRLIDKKPKHVRLPWRLADNVGLILKLTSRSATLVYRLDSRRSGQDGGTIPPASPRQGAPMVRNKIYVAMSTKPLLGHSSNSVCEASHGSLNCWVVFLGGSSV